MTPSLFFSRRRRNSENDAPAAPPAPARPTRAPARAARPQKRDESPAPARPSVVSEDTKFLIRRALRTWNAQIADLTGVSSLTDISDLGDACLDLSRAHPSGIAQLYAARPTRLTNLLREGAAYSKGRRAAKNVVEKAQELEEQHGQASLYLAIGVAQWTEMVDMPVAPARNSSHFAPAGSLRADEAGLPRPLPATAGAAAISGTSPSGAPTEKRMREYAAPILLRPVRITVDPQTDGDIELCLEPGIELNPALETSLRAAGSTLREEDVARSVVTEHGFTPRTALSMVISQAAERLEGFRYDERIMVAPFVNPGQLLAADLHSLENDLASRELVAALAGDPACRRRLAQELPEISRGDRAPDAERGVGDLAPVQQTVVELAAAGRSFMVDTAPGANEGDVIAAVLADAAASGKSVALVCGTHARAVTDRAALARLNLDDLILDLTGPRWRTTALERLRDGFVEHEDTLDDAAIIEQRESLVRTREVLGQYVDSLHREHEPWGVSAHMALQELARLTSDRPVPRTRVRLDGADLEGLTPARREELIDLLEKAAELGAFSLRRHQTAWYGAQLQDANQADRALRIAEKLSLTLLPELVQRAQAITQDTGLTEVSTVAELREQLTMLQGVRQALDVFSPQIFETSAAQMVVATATKQWREKHDVAMRRSTQRRLRKQARDMVRPGRQVDDLHAELVYVQQQAIIWRKHCPAGGWPRLPQGMREVEKLVDRVEQHFAELDPVLNTTLADVPFDELSNRMAGLANDVEGLGTLPERTQLVAEIRELGGACLVDDFTERRVPREMVRAEVELCWWASILETVLRSDRLLARYDGARLAELAEQFRQLDRAHIDSLPGPVRRAVGRRLVREVNRDKARAREYWRELSSSHPDNLRSLISRYRSLTHALRPIWIFAAAQISQVLNQDEQLDLVVLDGIQHTPTAHIVGVLARARQIVVFGDPRRRSESAVADLATILPHHELPTDRSDREEHVAAFLASHGYDGLVDSIPAPPSQSTLRLELVDGFGMPAVGADAVESVQTEVDRVVDLVVEHALSRPDESLAVIALNERHARRVEEAISRIVADSPAISDFFARDKQEPFAVVGITEAAGMSRDSIIMTVGYGKTPHGRVLHRLGDISGPDGLSLLIDALDDVRRELVVVSCFASADLDRDRLRAPGAELLYDLLAHIEGAHHAGASEAGELEDTAPDRLLVDLADRLWRLGLTVVPRYGVPGGVRIPLAIGHPHRPGELLVAVVTDDDAYVAEPSVRVRERHRIERLRDRGWRVHEAFSTAVFMDPQSEAERIVAAVVDVMAADNDDDATTPGQPNAGATCPVPAADTADHQGTSAGDVTSGDADAAPDAHDTGDDKGEGTDSADATDPVTLAAPEPRERGPRPDIAAGMPLSAYSDDQLDDMAVWIATDGLPRTDEEMVAALREELEITRRGAQIDAVLRAAAQRNRRER